MAMNLTAIFKVRDEGSAKLRKLTQHMERMNKTSDKVSGSITKSQSAVEKLGRSSSSASSGVGKLKSSFGGLATAVVGVASAYLSAQGAAKAFNATIGEAARYEQQAMALEGMFGNAKLTQDYLKMVDKAAIASPVLSSTDMISNSKAFVGLSKDVGQLQKVWSLVERIQAFSGADTAQASFSTKELFQGSATSIVEAIGLDRKEMQRIAKMDGLDSKVAALDQVLTKMGVGQAMVDKMGGTVLGQWSSIQETVQTFFRNVGMDSTSKLSKALKGVSKEVDKIFTNKNASKMGAVLGTIVEKAIEVGKFLWKWKEPIAYITGALTAALAVFGIVAVISSLANPISLIAAGIAAASVGLVALYKNSEKFRGAIDGIVSKAKDLFNAFKTGGAGGLLNAIFGEGTTAKVTSIIDTLKAKFSELVPGFNTVKDALALGWQTVSDIFISAWGIVAPILSGLWSLLQIIGDVAVLVFNNVIAPALSFIMQLFSTLWTVAQPILTLLAELFKILASVIKWLWDTILAPLVEFILGGFKSALDTMSTLLSAVSGWFEKIVGWASSAKDMIGKFADKIAGIKLPDWVTNGLSTVVTTVSKVVGGGKPDGSHYHGLDYVPRDNYVSSLHRGEMVLNARDAKAYREGKGGMSAPVINIAKMEVREESDIEKVAYQLAKLIEKEAAMIG